MLYRHVFGQLHGRQDLFDLAGHTPEIVPDRCHQHIDQTREVVVVHTVRSGFHIERGHVAQQHRWPAPFIAGSIEAVGEIHIASGKGCVL